MQMINNIQCGCGDGPRDVEQPLCSCGHMTGLVPKLEQELDEGDLARLYEKGWRSYTAGLGKLFVLESEDQVKVQNPTEF